jgi:transcriptional regulator with XRE-family HTH domain
LHECKKAGTVASRTLLRMEEQRAGARNWPDKEFATTLTDVLHAAGISDSPRTGHPNSAEFHARTGIDHSLLGRWYSGKTRPTIESLRKIAETFADGIDLPVEELYFRLVTSAGYTATTTDQAEASIAQDPLITLRHLYTSAGEQERQWIRGKLADVVEQIEMRRQVSRTHRGR